MEPKEFAGRSARATYPSSSSKFLEIRSSETQPPPTHPSDQAGWPGHEKRNPSSQPIDTSRLPSAKAVDYTSSLGHRLSVAHIPDTWLPDASVNGTQLDFSQWPISESPYVSSKDPVLDVNDGRSGFTIDWSGAHPIYTHYDLRDGNRIETSRRFLRRGSGDSRDGHLRWGMEGVA